MTLHLTTITNADDPSTTSERLELAHWLETAEVIELLGSGLACITDRDRVILVDALRRVR